MQERLVGRLKVWLQPPGDVMVAPLVLAGATGLAGQLPLKSHSQKAVLIVPGPPLHLAERQAVVVRVGGEPAESTVSPQPFRTASTSVR